MTTNKHFVPFFSQHSDFNHNDLLSLVLNKGGAFWFHCFIVINTSFSLQCYGSSHVSLFFTRIVLYIVTVSLCLTFLFSFNTKNQPIKCKKLAVLVFSITHLPPRLLKKKPSHPAFRSPSILNPSNQVNHGSPSLWPSVLLRRYSQPQGPRLGPQAQSHQHSINTILSTRRAEPLQRSRTRIERLLRRRRL